MAQQWQMMAQRVQPVVTPDKRTAGIVGWDKAGNEAAIVMDTELASEAITSWLVWFAAAGGYVPPEERSTTGPLTVVRPDGVLLAIGDGGQPLLRLAFGQAALTIDLEGSEQLRKLGAEAIRLADVIQHYERGLPRQ